MRIFKTILIDDEPQAIRLLEKMLLDFPQIKLLKSFEYADEALAYMRDNYFDILIVDIQMPEKTGFDVVAEAREAGMDFHVIFITAHDEYAVDAIRASAFDYLLKPVGRGDLEQTLIRLEKKITANSPLAGFDHLIEMVKKRRVMISDKTGYNYYLPDEIIYAAADGDSSELVLRNRRDYVNTDIDKLETILSENGFIRISDNFLVNKIYLTRFNQRTLVCRLICDEQTIELQVSSDRAKAMNEFIV